MDTLYTGWTIDLERRLREHRAARGSKYTRSRLPVELAGCVTVRSRTEARQLEAKVKGLPRELKLKFLESHEV